MRLLATLCVLGMLLMATGCGGSSQDTVTTVRSHAEIEEALSKMTPADRQEFRRKLRFAEEIISSEGEPSRAEQAAICRRAHGRSEVNVKVNPHSVFEVNCNGPSP